MEKVSSKSDNDFIEIDLQELIGILLHKAWIWALAMVIGAVIGFVYSAFFIAPQYESTTSVYILNKDNGSTIELSDTQFIKDYEKLITGRYVLEKVIDEFELNTSYEGMVGRVLVANEAGTRIVDITVRDTDPYLAQELANAIREVAAKHIKDVTDVEAVNVANVANLPDRPTEPSIMKWTVLVAAVGFAVAVAIIIICYLLDDTIKTAEDIEKYLELSTLALIPATENNGGGMDGAILKTTKGKKFKGRSSQKKTVST